MLKAREERGRKQLELPPAFTFDTDLDIFEQEAVIKKNTVFTLNLYALIDIEFKVDIELLNGLYTADRLMFERSAILEILRPERGVTTPGESSWVGPDAAFSTEYLGGGSSSGGEKEESL